jgi:paraquat-inducible protein B
MSPPPPEGPRQRTVSEIRRSRWPGWIWAVPLAAVGIVAWLLVRFTSARGFEVTLSVEDATGITAKSTKVLYRGFDVGEVSDLSLSKDRRRVELQLDIDDDLEPEVNEGSRFYLEGGTPSLSDLSSLKSIVAGPTITLVPGRGKPQRRFAAMQGSPPKPLDVSVPYLVRFAGDVGGLKPGAPVILRGFTVGEIDRVQLQVDARSASISTPVILLLDPTKFHLQGTPAAHTDWTEVMNATLGKLVQHHLRARLSQEPPLIGSPRIELEMQTDAQPATLLTQGGTYPEIPTDESGGGLSQFARKLGQVPIQQIGANVRAISDRIERLVASPQLTDSLRHLDHTLIELDATMQKVGPQLGPTIDSAHQAIDTLRQAAGEIDATSASARKVVGANPRASSGNLEQALRDLSGAARSIRALADYLDQHPEALLRGRPDQEALR